MGLVKLSSADFLQYQISMPPCPPALSDEKNKYVSSFILLKHGCVVVEPSVFTGDESRVGVVHLPLIYFAPYSLQIKVEASFCLHSEKIISVKSVLKQVLAVCTPRLLIIESISIARCHF